MVLVTSTLHSSNQNQYNNVYSLTPSAIFNHRFWNLQQIQFPTLDTGEATTLWKKSEKMKKNLLKIVYIFVSFSFLSDDFYMNFHEFDFNNLRNKANIKGSLHKNLEHWHHIAANPSVIYTSENS